ncbi:MAG: hypothetical protein ACM3NR_01820 [Methanosarcina sp.]
MKLKNHLFLLIASICMYGCNGKRGVQENTDLQSFLESEPGRVEISTESMNEIIESIPSPVEIAMIIKKSGTGFDEELLNRQDNSSLYTTDQSKALGIGIYSGDLGYINMYEKSFLTVNYLNTIKRLADDISIGQFFDFQTIKRLASNSDKMDSLIYLSTINFNKMDAFLRSQQRSNMSLLMVTGTWTEGLYIATRNYLSSGNSEIMEWIGYQKIIVNQLLLGLSAYKDDAYFSQIVSDMNRLKQLYDAINITYEYHEPESVEVDGRLVIVDKSTSQVDIKSEQVKEISELVYQIRARLVRNNQTV